MSDSVVKINWSKKKGELDTHGSQQLPYRLSQQRTSAVWFHKNRHQLRSLIITVLFPSSSLRLSFRRVLLASADPMKVWFSFTTTRWTSCSSTGGGANLSALCCGAGRKCVDKFPLVCLWVQFSFNFEDKKNSKCSFVLWWPKTENILVWTH